MTVSRELNPNVNNNPGLGSSIIEPLTTTLPATETTAPSAYRLATTHSSAPHSRVVKRDQRLLPMPRRHG